MGFYETTIGIFGSMQDKDIDGVIAAIAVHIDRWHVVDLPSERAATSVALAEMVSARCPGKPVQAHVGVREALLQALSQANRNDRILCFGSFLTAAEALAVLAPQ
jgi:dihydrofolate synthase/folylpolyglutamate synthase